MQEPISQTVDEVIIDNLDNGGRKLGNIVDGLLINPLSRCMFDNELITNCEIRIVEINADEAPYSLACETI